METKLNINSIPDGSLTFDKISKDVKYDWNALKGEAGYIENKPFGVMHIKDVRFGDNMWELWENAYIFVASREYNDVFLDDVGYIRFDYNMSHTFTLDGGAGEITVKNSEGFPTIVHQDYFETEEEAEEYLNNVLKIVYIDKLDSTFISDTVIKTTPQTLEYTAKNQALTNLGIQEKIEKLVNITYLELKALKDNSKLIPGQQYRIIDYVTTTTQENTKSVGHQFDIIVTADNEKTLNEEARACLHEGDTYFSEAGANLAAWQIWYSLDNDAERFAWADAENGKGVIYRMIDEWNNDCPYDFKNIQFKRNLTFENGYAEYSEDGVETWVYTFAGQSYHINNDEWSGMLDGSLESPFGHMSDEDTSTFHDNVIKPYMLLYDDENEDNSICGKTYLNDNVFLGYWEEIGSANDEDAPYYYAYCCYSNNFGNNCSSNSLGNNCGSNTFGNNCFSNTFGNDFSSNSFGNYCYSNSFGNNCGYNSFGDGCVSNSFGNSCSSNSLGSKCFSNTFGKGCNNNSLDKGCNNNSLGKGCNNNSLGNGCNNNSLGNGCNNNSFGNGCNSLELNESTSNKTASVNSSGETKVFNLADLTDLLNS